MSEQERETHFARFADRLMDELLSLCDYELVETASDRWRKEAEPIIARRAYDLVAHTIENTAHIDLDRLSTEEHVLRIPDLAELPKEEAEQ